MTVHLQEVGQILVPDVKVALTDPGTPHVTPYVHAANFEWIELVAHLAAAVAATAAEQVKFEVLAASAANGTGAEVVPFEYVYDTVGAATIKAGTGLPTKREMQDGDGVNARVDDWTTVEANGNKQNQIVIPVRTRWLPAGKPWVALRATPGATDRDLIFVAVLRNPTYGESGRTSLFA